MEFLKQRAEANFRDVHGELNAILAALRAQSRQETPQAEGASVTPLFPESADTASRGPLRTRSGYRGVYPYGKRWQASIREDGAQKRIGVYDSPEDAARAYDAYVREQSGGLAPVNFPGEGERNIEDPTEGITMDEETRRMVEGGPMGPRAQPGPVSFEDPPPGVVRVPRKPEEDDS